MGDMLLSGLGINQYIIHVHQDTLIQQICQQQIHGLLKMQRSILQPIWHDYTLKSPIQACKSSFKLVLFSNWHLVISFSQVQFAEIMRTLQPS